MAATFPNGRVPASALIVLKSGMTRHVINGVVEIESWQWLTTPGTYAKHLALVALAKRNTGRDLQPSAGFSFYRPLDAQAFARRLFGNGAASVGTSSHGGYWERRDTMAIDYHNWSTVYGGDRAAWYRDVRAVGLEPGLISRERGYPDEPWHVIDFAPYRAVLASGSVRPFEPLTQKPIGVEMYVKSNLDAKNERIYAVYTDATGHVRTRLCGTYEKAYALTGNLVITGEDAALNGLAREGLNGQPDFSVRDTVWESKRDVVDVNGQPRGYQASYGYMAALTNAYSEVLVARDPAGDVDVDAIAERLKSVLGAAVVDELAKRLAS